MEDTTKIHLCGWHDNNATKERVRARNLAKTRALIDEATGQWCDKYKISTKWTDDPAKALGTIDPPRSKKYP